MPRVLRKTRIREPGNVVVTTMPGPRVPKLYNGNSKAEALDNLSTIVFALSTIVFAEEEPVRTTATAYAPATRRSDSA